jgi:hypothetical protein
MALASQDHETSTDQRCHEWAKLICKLRWIGHDDEAERLLRAVCSLPRDERGPVSVGPLSTD